MAHYAQPLTRDLDQGPPHHHVLEAQQRRSQRARDQAMMLQMETLAENLCEQFASYYKALPPTATITTSTSSSHPSIPTTTTQHPKTGNASPQLAVIPAPPVISTDMIREHVLMMQEQFEAAILAHDAANSSSGGTPMPPAGGGGGAIISSGRLRTEKDPWPLGQQIAPRPPPTPPVVRRQRLANQAQQQEGTTTTATSATAVLSPRIPVSLQTRRVLGGSSGGGGVDGQYATNPFPLPPPSTTTYRPQGNSNRRRQPLPAANNNDEDDDDAPPAMIARADIDAELLAPVVAMSQVADPSKQNFSASASPALKAQLSAHETRSPRQRSENFRLLDCLLDGNTVCISQRKRKELSAVEQSLRDGAKFAPLPATVLEPAYLISSPRSSHYHQATAAGSNRDEMRFSNHPSVAGSSGPMTLTGSIGGGVSHSAAASLSTVVAAVKSSNRVATIAKRIREQRPEDGYAKQAEQHEAQLVALEAQKWKMHNGAKPKDWTPRDTVHQQALGRTKRAS